MSKKEEIRVSDLSQWYLQEQLDFDKRLIRFRYETIKPRFVGAKCLELGPAEGQMTRFLVNDFDEVTVVEGSQRLLDEIPDFSNLTKVHSLFEDYEPTSLFDTVILEHILEHVDDPIALLQLASRFLAPNGRLFVGVPNANSIHRLVAVKMGLLTHQTQLNSRDMALGHRRVYSRETLHRDIMDSGLHIIETGGVFFKPVSNSQIQESWSEEMIQGFFLLGFDFPEVAAELYAICSK